MRVAWRNPHPNIRAEGDRNYTNTEDLGKKVGHPTRYISNKIGYLAGFGKGISRFRTDRARHCPALVCARAVLFRVPTGPPTDLPPSPLAVRVADAFGYRARTLPGDVHKPGIAGDLVQCRQSALRFRKQLAIQVRFELQQRIV